MAYKYIGKDLITPPDVEAKVTGAAKYAEDFRAEGMVFAKLLVSPMPHAKVRSIDTSAAMALNGVVGILTADEVPAAGPPNDPILTNEPLAVGQPILAVAAVTEEIAANAVDLIKIDLQPLPFVIDPLDSLFPGGPTARTDGNAVDVARRKVETVNWTARDFLALQDGQLPMGQPLLDWEYGDVAAGFANAKLVLDESFVTAGTSHMCMETASSMTYWQGGKAYVHGSVQGSAFAFPSVASHAGVEPENVVFISEFCGGGFGSKIRSYPMIAIPIIFSKKIGRPVMLRVTRTEEYARAGSGRPGFQGRLKIGFREDGRVTAVDMFIVHDNGPNRGGGDYRSAASALSIVYQPEAMRFRGIAVLTNTPSRGAQRGPGTNQMPCIVEPMVDKAARELGLDRVAIRTINAPGMDGQIPNGRTGELGPITSSYLPEVLVEGAKRFNWEEKKKLSGRRNGTKVTGIGIGSCYHSAGGSGYDGLVSITPDGKLHIHNGCGNLGTYSYYGTSLPAAEVLGYNWDNTVIERGRSDRHLAWTPPQAGSNTSFTTTRQNWVAAQDAKAKLLEIAAMDLGGAPDDYELKNETVVNKSDASKSMTYAKAAQRAIELGGKYSGYEVPEDLNPLTVRSVAGLAGTALIGVSKDNLERKGTVPGLVVGWAHIELDTETGMFEIIEYLGMADVGTVLHPMGLRQQLTGGSMHGLGMANLERYVYDPQNGLPADHSFHTCRLPTYLDMPLSAEGVGVNLPDPQNPVGSKGVGEPAQGAGAGAILSAISDALGGHLFNRTPVVADMIINHFAGRPQSYKPLSQNTQ